MRLAILTLAASAACLNAPAQIKVFDGEPWTHLQVAAQVGNGVIEAAGIFEPWRAWHWNQNWQPSYNNSPWNAWGSSDTAGANPVSMESMPNGSVASLWERGDKSVTLLIQDGNVGHAKVRSLQGPAKQIRVFMDAQTNIWVTEAGLNIGKAPHSLNRLRLYQKPEPVHTITTDELWSGGDPSTRLPVSMAEDARGRIWFWSNYLLGGDQSGAIHGVLINDDGAITNRATLSGVANDRISVIAPLNETNLWLAVRNVGIFSVDLGSLQGAPVAGPEPGAFRVVYHIFKDGDDRYVIADNGNYADERGLANTLWRQRAGKWKKIIGGLDSNGSLEQFADRHWLATSDGLWLGAFGTGGWFVPRDDSEPRQISWQANSPLDTIDRWFQIKNGQMLAIQFNRGGLLADASLLLTKPAVAPSSEIFRTTRPLLQTGDGKIFVVLRQKEAALSEWDGKKWQYHPLPDGLQLWGDCQLLTDSKNRLWFIDGNYNPDPQLRPCLIFDSASGKFERYSGFPTALQAQAAKLADTRLGNGDAMFAAAFSHDGRICYEDRNTEVRYFDGHEWHHWNKNTIVSGGLMNWPGGKPYFDRDNKLSVFLNDKVWQLDDLGNWHATSNEQPKATASTATSNPPYLPEAESIVADRRGIFWATVRKQLFCAGYGLRASRFAPNEPQPFTDGRKILDVLVDNFGNAFLRTSLPTREEYVLVPARSLLPETKLKVAEKSDDGVTLELSTANTPRPRFIWRIDDEAWSDATTNSVLRLDNLESGKHRVQITAIDEQLQADPSPAETTFEVRSNPAERIGKWITQLSDKDFAKREAAVKLLARQPDAALPALNQALKQSTDAKQRWWIQAAIQACEQR